MNFKTGLNCCSCLEPFGVFFNDATSTDNAADNPLSVTRTKTTASTDSKPKISVQIQAKKKIVRFPYILVCKHKFCNYCVENNKKKNFDQLVCPLCQLVSYGGSLEIDHKTFSQSIIENEFENPINDLVDYNIKNTLFVNQINQLKVQSAFEKFLLKCFKCRSSPLSQHAQKHQLVKAAAKEDVNCEAYCFNCRKAYCHKCFEVSHANLDEHHNRLPILEMDIGVNKCHIHDNIAKYYSLKFHLFICSDCFIKTDEHKRNPYCEILTRQKKNEMLDEWKKAFELAELHTRNDFHSADREINFLNKSVQNDANETGFNLREININLLRQTITKKNMLEQAYFLIVNILSKINSMKASNQYFYISYHRVTIDSVFKEYMSLVSSVTKKPREGMKTQNEAHFSSPIFSLPAKPNIKLEEKTRVSDRKFFSLVDNSNIPNERTKNPPKNLPQLAISNNTGQKRLNQENQFADQTQVRILKRPGRDKLILSSDNSENDSNTEEKIDESANLESVDSPIVEKPKPGELLETKKWLKVKITLFESPTSLYVRLTEKDDEIAKLSSEIKKLSSCDDSFFTNKELAELAEGCIVGIFDNKELKKWQRGKILSKEAESESPAEIVWRVFMLDLGATLSVKASQMRKLSFDLMKKPQQSIHCYLDNIKPFDETDADFENLTMQEKIEKLQNYEWPIDLIELMIKTWTVNTEIEITMVRKLSDDFYGINMIDNRDTLMLKSSITASTAKHYGFKWTSLSELLVQWKLAEYQQKPSENRLSQQMPSFLPMSPLLIDDSFTANISNFFKFDSFYMKKLYEDPESIQSISKLHKRMQQEYHAQTSREFKITSISERMPVAALYEPDQNWYRGEVLKINPNSMVCDVLFVDFGDVQRIHIKSMRYLKNEFFVHEVLTFRCKLFGINFSDEEKHNKAANYFYDTIKPIVDGNKQSIKVQVKHVLFNHDETTIKNTYEIIIRFPIEGKLTNLNVLLSKLGFADVTNISIFEGEEPQAPRNTAMKILKREKRPSQLQSEVQAVSRMHNKLVKASESKILCKVTNCVSPSEIWVQDVVDSDNYFDKFQKFLAERYAELHVGSLADDENEWRVGDFCVLKHPRAKSQFFRAQIVHIEDDNFEVLCLDNGNYESNVRKEDLLELIEEFRNKPDFKAKKCFLVGVQPSGTSNGEWSSRAKNFTAEILNENFVHVAFKSEKKANDSYDVCIYIDAKDKSNEIYQLKPVLSTGSMSSVSSSASPTNDSYVRLADILNSKGLAFLTEKKQPMNMLLASKSAHKSNSLLISPQAHQTYPSAEIPARILRNSSNPSELYACLVTHVDISSGEFYMQLLETAPGQLSLSQLQQSLQTFYNKSDEESFYSPAHLAQATKQNSRLPCVCKHKAKYLRCEILSEKLDVDKKAVKYLVSSIDYGFDLIVDANNVYRPILQAIDEPRHAFKCSLNLATMNNFKANYGSDLNEFALNKLLCLRVDYVSDCVIVGDLYDKQLKVWATSYLSEDSDSDELSFAANDATLTHSVYSPFYRPSDLFDVNYQVTFMWVEDFNILWLKLFYDDSDLNEQKKNELSTNQNLSRVLQDQIEFNKMQDELERLSQANGLVGLDLSEIRPGLACCCFFPEDQNYYRAIVLKVNYIDELALVKYVDYGNKEEIGLKFVYKLDKKYLKLPVQAKKCRLKSLIANEPYNSDEMREELCAALTDNDLIAKFHSFDEASDTLEVELYFKNEQEQKLAYQNLIEKGLFSLDSSDEIE